jgi:hypothetical protein
MHFISRRSNLLYLSRFLFGAGSSGEPILTAAQIVDKKAINHDSYIYKLKFIDRAFQLGIGEHFRIIETIKTY